MSGEWLFRGTRVPVKALFENLEDGATVDDFIQWFPGVHREQAVAVLAFAEQTLLSITQRTTNDSISDLFRPPPPASCRWSGD